METNQILEDFLSNKELKFAPHPKKVPLAAPTYGKEEVIEALDSLLSSFVTMGSKVKEFENQFADYIGAKHACMVNSGSSANLLAFSALMSKRLEGRRLEKGDEVLVPAVTWPTTIYPIAQLGMVPVLVDIDIETFNISCDAIEKAITPKTKAICIVPILGNPCQMDRIQEIAKKHDLIVVEDTCESLGSSFNGKKCGTFGDMGTFSFFFSHHMTTIEGGMVVTNDDEYADSLKCQRAHGWVRDMSTKEQLIKQHSEIDPRFLFVDWGYNLRPTEVSAAFGIHQLKKLDGFNEHRIRVANAIIERTSEFKEIRFPLVKEGTVNTWFGLPFLLDEKMGPREKMMQFLEAEGIETRPITGGNLARQPAFDLFQWRKGSELTASDLLDRTGIYIGTHPGMDQEQVGHVINSISAFMRKN